MTVLIHLIGGFVELDVDCQHVRGAEHPRSECGHLTGTAKQPVDERLIALEPGDERGTRNGAAADQELPPANAARGFARRAL